MSEEKMETAMPNAISQRIRDNYTIEAIGDRVRQALEKSGLGSGPLQWSDLIPFDQFHVGGVQATEELAGDLRIQEGQSVLDVGSGFGGAARYLAAVRGARVTGIDLTPDFVQLSHYLSRRAGLTDKLTFQQGDATGLPFPNETFDIAWTQHVAINIQDKAKLYQGIHRVLKPKGRLGIYDPIRGDGQPIIYPTPWAREEGISFVADEKELREALTGAGFENVSVIDKTESAAQWFHELRQQRDRQQQSGAAPDPLSPLFILRPEMGPAIANFAQNVLRGRVRIVQIIAHKA